MEDGADGKEVRVVVVPPAGVDEAVVFARAIGWACVSAARREDGRVTLRFER